MRFLPVTKSWRHALLIGFGIFLLSRVLTLKAFPIFNDETIYLQYCQRIHDDWQQNKFISMNGEFTDWKPPLMYWMAAPFIEWGNDPLVAGRAVAFLVSVAGFIGFYLFAKQLFGEREGVAAALLYVLCPPIFLHNDHR
jgi:4-amino-4-deoxy-L-arabinose transferase-like glycosyltransferase